jgi:GMP synthase-like glutamine amidotransferase
LTPWAASSGLFGFLPRTFTAFHWHGDTFNLPDGAVHLARSAGCEHQAFLFDDRVLGLQFHLESTEESVRELACHCESEIVPSDYIQPLQQIISPSAENFNRIHQVMFGILDRLPVR